MLTQNRLTRRRFLAMTGAAVAAPCILPPSVFGLDGTVAPNSRFVMGCIGVGGQGTRGMAGGIWAPAGGFIGRPEIQVVGVCDVNAHHRENARHIVNQRYGNQDCAVYGDFRELLARKDIDVLLIATGERWHPLLSIAAAKAGKDAYCEKPTSVTIAEAQALRAAVRRYGMVYQVGTQQRSSYAFRFACELARNGYIGDLRTAVVGVGGPPGHQTCSLPAQPVPDWLDYDMWLGPCPWRPYNAAYVGAWMAYRDFSGGEMTNWGAHHFDIAQWGLGTDHSGPVEIIPPDGKEFKVLTYRYANGAEVVRDPDRLQREAGVNNGVMFIGTTGKVAVWRYELRTWPEHLSRVKIKPDEIHLHVADNHHTDFLNSVRARSQPGANIEIASRSITVCHLGNIAYQLGRPLRWNPDKEEFVNDPEANRMRFRQMRSPWEI
ncbi:MAG: Gfo/Idh/MocA family oxidoreductase [Verrucomicrobia bacterium]|nr:Gfo/Idh/MocA family oxidoreductase [Verrucomicrobiota bacterium]